jgi:putative transposase
MDERLRFVARLLEGEKMAPLCREFDISRKTGYKIFQRYKGCGLEGLTDRSRRPYRQANQLPFQIEKLIVQLKREHSSWGAPKIREKLRRLHSEMRIPAISTVHAVLYRHGLVNRGRRRRFKAQGTTLSRPLRPTNCGAPITRASSCSAIHRAHGHRHAYAQTRYFELTGHQAPAVGGPRSRKLTAEQKSEDREVRLIISAELGHEREQITAVYLGR